MLSEEVRRHCARVAAAARWVRIDPDALPAAGGVAGLDPGLHYLDAPPDEVARYVLVLDAINFGSAWFEELGTGTDALTRPPDRARPRRAAAPGARTSCAGVGAGELGAVLALPPSTS